MKRIAALDMLRGYALAAIMVDHMPDGVLRHFTLANFAVFDAAELFVLLSGFLVGLVWLTVEAKAGRRAAQKRFLRRAFQVWLALVLGGILLALVSRFLVEAGLPHTAVWGAYARWIFEFPIGYIVTLGTLWMQPNLLDVLALYVVVLAFTPITVPLMLRWPWAFALGSLAMWAMSIPLNDLLPNQRGANGMLFNPFAWQLLFHSGVAMGLFRTRFMPILRQHATTLTLLAVAYSIFGVAMAQLWRYGPELKEIYYQIRDIVGSVDKWSMDWVRYVGILAAAWLVAVPLARPMAWLADTVIGRALAMIGRGGLVTFIACVMLSVIGDALMTDPDGASVAFRLAVESWTLGVLWLVGIIAARRSKRNRVQKVAGS
ncbi:OpgC domain-containing protein [Paracoccus albus]|uniref:OpgC domain-containing protein n=1 Tax=Paracoccus albus TaxID=3017784 RepID=UPI0022F10C7D|nr:OpgC domain-containing protein [Paracoccus albus]WBU60932.1 OpgC domain-containing protein [Paracoccus albus]